MLAWSLVDRVRGRVLFRAFVFLHVTFCDKWRAGWRSSVAMISGFRFGRILIIRIQESFYATAGLNGV